jgi:hypothetical protein
MNNINRSIYKAARKIMRDMNFEKSIWKSIITVVNSEKFYHFTYYYHKKILYI